MEEAKAPVGRRDYGAINDTESPSAAAASSGTPVVDKADDTPTFTSRRDKLVFICLGLNNVFVSICFAVMSPFFPTVAAQKSPDYIAPIPPTAGTGAPVTSSPDETTSTLIGLVFTVATVFDFIFSPLVGKELPNVGPKLVFILGCSLVSGVTILFGFVEQINHWETFLAICYALRAVQGVGTACMFTASFTILAGAFPKSVGVVTGVLEVFSGVGFMIGPAIGGGLYAKGGFRLPFWVTGLALALSTLLVAVVLPAARHKKEERVSLMTILKQPRTWLMIPTALFSASSLGFLDPSLGPFLNGQFHLSPSKIGLVFLIAPGVYAVLAPLVGYVGDTFTTLPLIPSGLLVTGIAYQLFGPTPVLPLKPALWRTSVGLATMGAGIALSLVPTGADMLVTMRGAGYQDSLPLHSAIGGVMGASFSLGEGLGPSLGGLLNGAVGFGEAASVFGAFLLFLSVIVTGGTVLGLVRKRLGKETASVSVQDGDIADNEEVSPLLRRRNDSDGVSPKLSRPLVRRSLSLSQVPDAVPLLTSSPPKSFFRASSIHD